MTSKKYMGVYPDGVTIADDGYYHARIGFMPDGSIRVYEVGGFHELEHGADTDDDTVATAIVPVNMTLDLDAVRKATKEERAPWEVEIIENGHPHDSVPVASEKAARRVAKKIRKSLRTYDGIEVLTRRNALN